MDSILIVVGIVIVSGLLVWLITIISASRRDSSGQSSAISLLQQQLEALKTSQDGTSQVLQKSLQAGQENISSNLQNSQKILTQLNTQIGELYGTNKQMHEVGNEVKRLQNILSSPKLRGQIGER